MVLVLPENPSFGQRIGRGLGAGVAQGASAFADQFASRKQKEQMNQMMQQENEQIKQLTGLDLSGIQDPAQRKEFITRLLQGKEAEKEFGREQELLDIEQRGDRTLQQLKQQFESDENEKDRFQKSQGKGSAEDIQSKKIAQDAFNSIASILKRGNVGRGSSLKSGILGGKYAEDRGEMMATLGGLESALVEMVNKGTLSDTRFKYIKDSLLPNPSDRDAVIKGKLKGLAKILDLDVGVLNGDSEEGLEDLSTASAQKYKGRVVEDDKGNRYRSNGKHWIKE